MDIKLIILGILILASAIFYFQITGQVILEEVHNVTRVIDGDTIELENGQKVRMMGINTPEKNIPFYDEATEFLKNKIEGKEVMIENYGTDKYGRILGYVILENQNVNKEILEKGLGTLYYYEEDEYFKELKSSEGFARTNQEGIWKKSPNADCLELVELKYKEQPERCTNDEKIIIKNNCDKRIQFIYKDDATHIYYEIAEPKSTVSKEFSCIWNDAGDSLYAFDQEGLLIFFRYVGE